MADAAPTPPGGQQDDPQPHKDIARWTKAVAIFTGLLFVVSAIADFFIWGQYRVANQAQIDTREQLRAVVTQYGGDEVVIRRPDHSLVGINFIAHLRNSGGSRTAWFHGWISAHYFDGTEPPNNLDLTKPYDRTDINDVIIAQNSPYDLGPVSIPGSDGDKIFARQGVGLVWGVAEYADIFEPNKAHPINFCILITAAAVTGNLPAGSDPPPPRMTPYRADCNSSK